MGQPITVLAQAGVDAGRAELIDAPLTPELHPDMQAMFDSANRSSA